MFSLKTYRIPSVILRECKHGHLRSILATIKNQRLIWFGNCTRSLVSKSKDEAIDRQDDIISSTKHLDNENCDGRNEFGREKIQHDSEGPNHRGALHIPVMKKEAIQILAPKPGQVFVDMTFGAGGHSRALLAEERDIRIFVLDRDPDAYDIALELSRTHPQVTPLLGRFSDVGELLASHQIKPGGVDGFLFDTGVSSMQFDRAERGFSVNKDGPLDMRMDKNRLHSITAADVVNFASVDVITDIIKKYGEEKFARRIARAIEDHRVSFGPITGTNQLAEIISRAFAEGLYRRDSLNRHSHVATKTFMALRTFVNNELNELYNGLEQCHHFLSRGGVAVAITFHSLEDRIVKRQFHGIDMSEKCNLNVVQKGRRHAKKAEATVTQDQMLLSLNSLEKLTKNDKWRPLTKSMHKAEEDEVSVNPRSRSAKLRAAYKL